MTNRKLRFLLALLKIVLPLGLIAWLLVMVGRDNPETFTQLISGSKRWDYLLLAFLFSLVAVSITFFRWYLLVRAVGILLRVRDVFQLGCLGYLLNFVGLGSVGGDLFKAIFIARDQPSSRTEAIATVIVDRCIGMYSLFLFVTLALLSSDVASINDQMKGLAQMVYIATGLGTLMLTLILLPGFTTSSLWESLASLPRIGPTLGKMVLAMRLFRRSTKTLLTAIGASLCVCALFSLSLNFAAKGLFAESPSLPEHAVIVPISMLVGAIPLTPGGLGAFEGAMTFLYENLPSGDLGGKKKGVIVALCYRIITIAIASIGIIYYWMGRIEIREVMQKAKQETKKNEA